MGERGTMTGQIKVAAYCRVSTDYEDQLNFLSTQIKYFTDYISDHDGCKLIEVYYDEGITGTSVKKRDGFNRMISDAEKGAREDIINDLLSEIMFIQQNEPAVNCIPLEVEIESFRQKKQKAIDLMLDDLISKEDLKEQTAFYNEETAKLTLKIAESKNVSSTHQRQLDGIHSDIDKVNKTANLSTDSTEIYGELPKKVVVHENCKADFYLNCVPFGFRIGYHVKKFNQQHRFDVFVDSCEVIA